MTNQEAVRILNEQRNKFMDEWVDFGNVNEAYDMAIALLKEQEAIFLRDGHHICCTHCGEFWCDSDREGNPFPMNFCPHCGRAVKWND